VVAADGRRSFLREAAGIKVVGWSYPQTGIVTTVAHERPHEGVAVQHFLPAGPFAILPLCGDRSCITWTEDRDEARRILALDDAAFLAEVDLRFGGRLGTLSLAGPRGSWPLEMHLARSYVAPRLALVGDAAHGVHPIAGQGLNLALRDVAALAEVVADAARLGLDIGSTDTLRRYERWRRFDSVLSAAAFDGLNRLFSNDWTLLRTIRDAGLGLVDRLPAVKRMFVGEAAGLSGELPRLVRGEQI
jgi:2-octaprenyl-6-methoxyphenol hydroxylase